VTPKDLEEVLSIEREAYKNPWSMANFVRELENPVSFTYTLRVARDNRDRLAGYVVFWVVYGEAHILNVTIRSGLRRQGLGTWLVREVLSMMEKNMVADVFLEVRRSNDAAIALYKKLGFEETFERKNYYGDEDAMVLRLVF
jgi:ribosomal-protein-alanine N-acetyltransferase